MKKTIFIMCLGANLLFTLPASATPTTVNDVWGPNGNPGPEWNLYNTGVGTPAQVGNGVLEYLYGTGNFSRVNDANDIQWVGLNGGASALVKYSDDSQALYTANLAGAYNSSSPILSVNVESGTPSRSTSATSFNPVSQPFLFMDKAIPGSVITYAYSDPTLTTSTTGVNGVDRMVTFTVTGYLTTAGNQSTWTPFADGTTHYVLAFENGEDYDFNDLVVEVSGVSPADLSVPDGGTTVGLLGIGLAALASLRRWLARA